MIRDDVFIFDNVVHMYDYSDENLKDPDDDFDREYHLRKVLRRRQTASTDLYADWDPIRGFAHKWTSEEMGRLLFGRVNGTMIMLFAAMGTLGPVATENFFDLIVRYRESVLLMAVFF